MRSPLRFPEPSDPHLSLRIPPDSLITGPASGDISNEACRSLNCSSSRYCSRFLENRDVSTKDIGTIRHWRIAAKKFFVSFATTVCPVLVSDILFPSAQTSAVRETGGLMQNWRNRRSTPVLYTAALFHCTGTSYAPESITHWSGFAGHHDREPVGSLSAGSR